ncbi:uncharacterized protein K460DRAFT_413384 [Cucurbitaria berberidis CBS 394.84]|uniref:N-acetyltransferase domain-containing protein n=1 Tax=Cucurbitaria berberidis CBS 394.84 TaxID=1168544 RepID=A0A9P4GV20_9PLEO|nr:uncharacterized protein K460DRAFT_413384 [Cucurbitaria berberidis CBS 394.84]KAF1851890.1 hypothetical protein K460DRAFT_413384 [Cucurbitaria berberidis CBS 394.84]
MAYRHIDLETISNDHVRDNSNSVLPTPVPTDVVFGEATPDQRLQCYKLAAAAFGSHLSEADFVDRETFLNDQPLTRNGGCRVWCLYRANAPSTVLSTCRTIRRAILLKDSHGIREEIGYCIVSVVTSTEHRGQGLASLLLHHVAQWLDGPGQAAVSMLYSNREEFYAKNGWVAMPAAEISITGKSSIQHNHDSRIESALEALGDGDITQLCARDVQSLRSHIETVAIAQGDILATILPTAELISLQHARADFVGLKLNGTTPQRKGVRYASKAWLYWHHDFRKQCLYIQRLRTYVKNKSIRIKIIVALFLQACQEAERWGLPRVVTWDLSSDVCEAAKLLGSGSNEGITTREARRKETMSLRWTGGVQLKSAAIAPNEAYAWN